MADTVRKVYTYTTAVPDRPGEAFRVLATLVSGGVNLLGCRGWHRGKRAHIDVVPEDARRFAAVARRGALEFSQKQAGFLIQGEDRPGALAATLKRLADRSINVKTVEGLAAGAGRWAAIVWVSEPDVQRAGRALRSAG